MKDRSILFTPATVGQLEVPNRVFMAPLTRNRAHSDGTPKSMAQTYYRQRASAGLIISEATQISAMGKGYLDTPGIYKEEHAKAWKEITDAVHAGGGRIFCQLWHVGRISHVSLLPTGRSPVSSSSKRAKTQTFTADGFEDCSDPVPLDHPGIVATITDYVNAASKARQAGFDGIEVHAANGYLIDQFLQDGVNDRADQYGGSVENRARFLQEVLDAVSDVWPAQQTGVRLSPLGQANDIHDSNPEALFSHVYEMLSERSLSYLHVVERFPGNEQKDDEAKLISSLRQHYSGFYIANGDYGADSAARTIGDGHADAVTFGRPFIANPDLPERYRLDADLNTPDQDTFYGGDEAGYTDYEFLDR